MSPHWEVSTFENDAIQTSTVTYLWVLNPGSMPVKVTVVFHTPAVVGGMETVSESVTCTKTVPPGVSVAFWAPLFCETGSGNGSFNITASGPVLPGGYVQYYRTPKTNEGQMDPNHSTNAETMCSSKRTEARFRKGARRT